MIERAAVRRVTSLDERVWVGALLVVLAVLSLLRDTGGTGDRPFGVGSAVILAVGVAGLLMFGRRAPGLVALGIIGLTVLWYSLGHASSIVNVLTLVAFYNLGLVGDRRRSVVVGAVTLVVVAVAMLVVGDEEAADAASAIGWVLSALLLGALLQGRRLLVDSYRRRAELAEASREADAERRAQEVRVEIARDLHDLLAHTLSVMMVQANVAAEAVERDPDATRRALAEIRRAGRDATEEIGSVVEVLRDRAEAPVAPLPGIDRITELAAALHGGGTDVTLEIDDVDGVVPEAVGLTAYRVVQESLTNVVRHSCAPAAIVRVGTEPGAGLVIEVVDSGPERVRERSTGGYGLIGMRERVESLGGWLEVGPSPDGGWRVRAVLPLRERPAAANGGTP